MWCSMLCRAALVTVVLAYLICVLLLSGVQKEDLDEGTLTKLQRHNVNIEDIDAKLKNDCFVKVHVLTTEAGSESKATITGKPVLNTIPTEEPIKSEMDKILEETLLKPLMEFISKKKQEPNNDYRRYNQNTLKTQNTEPTQKVELVTVTEKEVTRLETVTSSTKKIIEDTGQYPQRNFIQFWQTYVNNYYPKMLENKNQETTSTSTAKTTENIFLENIVNRNIINDMTLSLINNNHIINAPVEDLKNFFDQYYKKPKDIEEKTTTLKTNTVNKNMLNEVIDLEGKVNAPKIINHKERVLNNNDNYFKTSKLDNYFVKNNLSQDEFYSKLQLERQINNDFQSQRNVNDHAEAISQRYYKYIESTTVREVETRNPTQLKKKEDVNSYANNNMNSGALKEIAKSIKDSVLQDLREDILHYAYKEKDHTIKDILTPEKTNQQKSVDTKNTEERQMLHKITLMLEQLQLSKNRTLGGHVNEKRQNTKVLQMPYLPQYVVKEITEKQQIERPYYSPQRSKTLNIFTSNRKPVIELNGFKKVPITIQTNSGEIPPLAISVQNPPVVIHENIIVTTESPYKKGRNERQRLYWDFNMKVVKDQEITDTFNFHTTSPPIEEKQKYLSEDYKAPHIEGLSRHRTSGSSKNTQQRNREWWPDPVKGKKENNNAQLVGYSPNRNYGRFHEKLEKTELINSSEYPLNVMWQDGNISKIAPRQQLSLNNIKRGARYDDTHFKNFIKTQEKVNDMLERILATKKIPNGIQSVEVA